MAAGAPLPGQAIQQLGIKAHEKHLFDSLFFTCDGSRSGPGGAPGTVSGGAIKQLFTASRLPKQSLAQIWTLSDRQRRKALDQEDFYIACRLIAIAQQNMPVTYQSLKAYQELPLPQFEGINAGQQMQPGMGGQPQMQQGGGLPPQPQMQQQQQLQQQQQPQQQQRPRHVAPMTSAGPGLGGALMPLGGP